MNVALYRNVQATKLIYVRVCMYGSRGKCECRNKVISLLQLQRLRHYASKSLIYGSMCV